MVSNFFHHLYSMLSSRHVWKVVYCHSSSLHLESNAKKCKFHLDDESCEYILKSRILVALALHVPRTAEAVWGIATKTPIHELLPGEVDCQANFKLWTPSKVFSFQVNYY